MGKSRAAEPLCEVRRSLKKEAKLKAKKVQAWGERQANQRKEQQAKQAKCASRSPLPLPAWLLTWRRCLIQSH